MENKDKERERDEVEFSRGELPRRYIAKLLYGWDDKKFDEEDWKKLERNWNKWKKERKKGEKEYMKKVWNEMREIGRRVRRSGGTKKKFLWKRNPKRGYCYGTLGTLTFFFFLLSIFLDFIFLFF